MGEATRLHVKRDKFESKETSLNLN
jgi:hypothetical protein